MSGSGFIVDGIGITAHTNDDFIYDNGGNWALGSNYFSTFFNTEKKFLKDASLGNTISGTITPGTYDWAILVRGDFSGSAAYMPWVTPITEIDQDQYEFGANKTYNISVDASGSTTITIED